MTESRHSMSGGRRVWRFANCVFDEARWRLSVDGAPVELEIKPLELLLELLRHPGEVLTKDELMEAVWPATTVVEGSLTTAISKLRKALDDEDQAVIATVPRIGYRLGCPVTSEAAAAPARRLSLEAGQTVPGRPQWRLTRRVGASQANEVWIGEHAKTGELRVFKFAEEPAFLRFLKREATLSRLLSASLGERPDFGPVLEWNFDAQPFFLEIAYRGQELPAWADAQGGLAGVPLAVRLDLAAQICATVAAAHGVGVLHRDLKPGNVVVAPVEDGGWRTAVVDFGSAELLEPERLAALNITDFGLRDQAGDDSGGGPLLYLAPERHAGGPASTGTDVFALGVLLYQLAVGDLTRPLAAGWEREVADPLLREDIAAAAAGDPDHRLASAADLAARLRSLDARRQERARQEAEAGHREALERELAAGRARRPWVALAGIALAVGALASSLLYAQARHDREVAQRQTHVAELVNDFLANDLLARSSPFKSGQADVSLVAAVKQAAGAIDSRFRTEPAVAARLHQTIARALDRRSDWPGARQEYRRAFDLWTVAQGAASTPARIVRLQTAMMEARSYETGSLPRAKALLAEQGPAIDAMKPPPPALAVWLASARGMTALVGDDAKQAAKQFGLASAGADAHPELFSLGERLTFLQRLAFAHIRLGEGAEAARLFRRLADGYAGLEGKDGADVLMVRMNLAQALMIQGRHAEAINEATAVYPKMLAVLGPEHEMTLQLLSTRAQSEGALERWDAAFADTSTVHRIAVQKQGEGSFFAIAPLIDEATSQCRAGRRPAALANFAQARNQAHIAFPGAALQDAADYGWAACLLLDGQVDAAAKRLVGLNRAAVAQLSGDPDWGANVDLADAQIAFARHDLGAARRALAAAAPAFGKPAADPYQARAYRLLREKLAS
ncbi:MAG TPA: winged helix-turn-helix domain-containing protein [Phenylobacterium sp.]|uniref:winged helix-turn-helix domain-containing protein n=1 Tax=Phenylobacterium sp. TaxID=1871053 RepID=UPI002D40F3E1|nr:winged helix-turn-helix domain-containing protein [Phenylobacterium sp.]HZZ69149.1 winged helix-turn-helix domain-containing protein [Phenylobacterium sp.]